MLIVKTEGHPGSAGTQTQSNSLTQKKELFRVMVSREEDNWGALKDNP